MNKATKQYDMLWDFILIPLFIGPSFPRSSSPTVDVHLQALTLSGKSNGRSVTMWILPRLSSLAWWLERSRRYTDNNSARSALFTLPRTTNANRWSCSRAIDWLGHVSTPPNPPPPKCSPNPHPYNFTPVPRTSFGFPRQNRMTI